MPATVLALDAELLVDEVTALSLADRPVVGLLAHTGTAGGVDRLVAALAQQVRVKPSSRCIVLHLAQRSITTSRLPALGGLPKMLGAVVFPRSLVGEGCLAQRAGAQSRRLPARPVQRDPLLRRECRPPVFGGVLLTQRRHIVCRLPARFSGAGPAGIGVLAVPRAPAVAALAVGAARCRLSARRGKTLATERRAAMPSRSDAALRARCRLPARPVLRDAEEAVIVLLRQ